MSEHDQTQQRRTEGTARRRYQHGGRQRGQSEQVGQSYQSERPATQSSRRFGQQSRGGGTSQQSSRGGIGQQTGGGQTGGQMGQQSGGRMGGGSQMGGQPSGGQIDGGQSGSQMGGQQMSGGQAGTQMSGGPGGGQMGGGQMRGGQVGGQTSGGQSGSQMGGRQTSGRQQVGQMGPETARQAPISPVRVRDVAATDVVTARPDAPVSEIAQKMAREDVGAVVVTEGQRPVGIVTDRKIALALDGTADPSRLQATDLMSEELVTVSEGANVFDLVRRLSEKGVRRVPVVGDQGDLRGIVSLDDVIVLLAEEFSNVSEIIRKQSPRF